MSWLEYVAEDLGAALADPRVWASIGIALFVGAGCFVLGSVVAAAVGLLDEDAPTGERIGVGLGCGLMLFAVLWATFASGGRSAFTPIAAALAVAVAVSVPRLRASKSARQASGLDPLRRARPLRQQVYQAGAAAGILVAIGLLVGATQAPSPRGGLQPTEFTDVGYYSALALSLNKTGEESTIHPSGFDDVAGLPSQDWYHWGEIWIAAALVRVFDLDAVIARNYVVLPLLLLAAACLTGTLVRKFDGSASRGPFLFGAAVSLLLAPVQMDSDAFFAQWAVGNAFGVGLYGLALITTLLSLNALVVAHRRPVHLPLTLFSGASIASLLPTHVVVAVLAMAGTIVIGAFEQARSFARTRTLVTSSPSARILGASALIGLATLAFGVVSGHGIPTSAPSSLVSPFNHAWARTIAQTALLSGVYLTIPVALVIGPRLGGLLRQVLAGTVVVVGFGAVLWGFRLADFNSFHLYFAAIAVFATPMAAIASLIVWRHLRRSGRNRLAMAAIVLAIAQLEVGVAPVVVRLIGTRAGGYAPIPIELLEAIKHLPEEAKLAYACQANEEFTFSDPRLSTIYAHTGRRVIPMCFQQDILSALNGGAPFRGVENPLFLHAPQRLLYPDSSTYPSADRLVEFFDEHGIRYVYSDLAHPNTLVPKAIPISSVGGVTISEIR